MLKIDDILIYKIKNCYFGYIDCVYITTNSNNYLILYDFLIKNYFISDKHQSRDLLIRDYNTVSNIVFRLVDDEVTYMHFKNNEPISNFIDGDELVKYLKLGRLDKIKRIRERCQK